MSLKIHNSLTRTKEEFKPLTPPQVKMYVCGPTVYDEPHLGHLRSAYTFDMMRRYLEYSGYKVTFVRNVTDVDDKIIEKARQSGGADLVAETVAVSSRYLSMYKADLVKLGITEPTFEPKATDHIAEMAALIEKLIATGHAYLSEGDVYFSVDSSPEYGKLSGQKRDSMLEGVRIDASEKKRNPLDFALWKKSRAGEPSWDILAGGQRLSGRPGWHIECSAMSAKYLGESFDIHGGGRDLIFPHHENEIAQSECASGRPFAKYWVHHGLITVEHVKMSKSLKNFVTLKSVVEGNQRGIEEIKMLFLGTHYASPLDYSVEKMVMVRSERSRFVELYLEAKKRQPIPASLVAKDLQVFVDKFAAAMDDDFNTPQALAVLHEIVHFAWKSKEAAVYVSARDVLCKLGAVLGLDFSDKPSLSVKDSAEVQALIQTRRIYKQNKEYNKADDIRKELLEKYRLVLKDLPDGSTECRDDA